MSAIDEPALGLYGTWEAANLDCVAKGVQASDQTRLFQLLFASICGCQVLFMASRAPRVAWEAIYLPLVETILYGLAASGNGNLRVADGRVVPIARFCSWLITCPIMLFQVVGIAELTTWGVPVRNLVMAAALIRTVFGIGASVSLADTTRWAQFGLACGFFIFEMIQAHRIFAAGLEKFGASSTKVNDIVYVRLQVLRFLFFVSWNSFPIIWLLSSTGFCAIGEDATVLAYLIADMICKNLYGIINTNTLFRVLDGKWQPEAAEGDQERSKNLEETYWESMFTRMGGKSHRDQPQELVLSEHPAVPSVTAMEMEAGERNMRHITDTDSPTEQLDAPRPALKSVRVDSDDEHEEAAMPRASALAARDSTGKLRSATDCRLAEAYRAPPMHFSQRASSPSAQYDMTAQDMRVFAERAQAQPATSFRTPRMHSTDWDGGSRAMHSMPLPRRLSGEDLGLPEGLTEEVLELARRITVAADSQGATGRATCNLNANADGEARSSWRWGGGDAFGGTQRSLSAEAPRSPRRRGSVTTMMEHVLGPSN